KVCGACLSRAALNELQHAGLGSLVEGLGAIALSEFQLRFRGRLLRMDLAGGAAVSRERFDAALVAAAVDSGGRFRDGALAQVDAQCGEVRHMRLMHEGRGTRLAARTILNATGLGQCTVPGPSSPEITVKVGSRIGAGCRICQPPAVYSECAIFM